MFPASVEWYDETYGEGRWGSGVVLNLAIGQGEIALTPLKLAQFVAAVVNGGELMRPRLVTAMTGKNGTRAIGPQSMGRVISGADARAINEAMVQAVEGRLGRRFTSGATVSGVTVAGKSGTAELGGNGEPHSWFIGFAPAESPEVAIAVLVEQGGRGGEVASPIAGQLMTQWLRSGE